MSPALVQWMPSWECCCDLLRVEVARSEQRVLEAIAALRTDVQQLEKRIDRLETPLVRRP